MVPTAYAHRFAQLPPYIFVELDRMRAEAVARGEDIINLGIGDPDQPTPRPIVEALIEAAQNPAYHRYPSNAGLPAFRQAAAGYYARQHGVKLDPETEIATLIGSKDGIAHMPLAYADPGDVVLVPEPGYPVYRSSALFAGAEPYTMPLRRANGFLPDLDAIPDAIYARTKIMYLNYPNNPTAAFAPRSFFEAVVERAAKHGFIVVHDAAYLDVCFAGEPAISFLSVPGAREVGIEMCSLSKTFNMTGWRIGFVAGRSDLVAGLSSFKANIDSGVFNAIQAAGAVALNQFDRLVPQINLTYHDRVNALTAGMAALGWEDYQAPRGTFYVWLQTRGGLTSMEMTKALLQKASIVVVPGLAFGGEGEGFFRMAMTTSATRIAEACERIKEAGL
ncbi:MAG: LL-diaminopimelate aminotransferase [Candidatus Sumerlaeaceae bacterium]|nr:LL-diaminopimelate aminotransferase [Candidatus Sumerlaeaceae bacterium]